MSPKPIPPREIIMLLAKLGFISSDKVDAAHQAIEQYLKAHASSTPPKMDMMRDDVRKNLKAYDSSMRPLPPPIHTTSPEPVSEQQTVQ